jgi:uncharacterized delta-60 repeat protein
MKYKRHWTILFLIFISSSCTDEMRVKRLSSPASPGCSSNASGFIDTTFGLSGFIEIDDPTTSGTTNGYDYFKAVTTTSDGSLFVAGTTMIAPTDNSNSLIAKINPNAGSIETSFGTNGYVMTGKHDDATEIFHDIVSQSTQHIVAVGAADSPSGLALENDFSIIRVNSSSGAFTDAQFDGSTDLITTCSLLGTNDDEFNAVAVDSSDDIYATGFCSDGTLNGTSLIVGKYNSSTLNPVTAFGTNGYYAKQTTPAGGNIVGNDILIDSNGRVVIAGSLIGLAPQNSDSEIILLRLNSSDGTKDNTFIVTDDKKDVFGQLNSIAEDASGNLYGVGRFHNGSDWDMAIWKFQSNGQLDTSFGTSGRVTFDSSLINDVGRKIEIDSCGKLVIFGAIGNQQSSSIWRYNPDGSLDTSFANGTGYVYISPSSNKNTSYGGLINSQGQIISVGGILEDTTNSNCIGYQCDLFMFKLE